MSWRSRFEVYPEGDAVQEYGKEADDPFGLYFPDFEYMSMNAASS